jgi:Protein of unknown function (DUF541)
MITVAPALVRVHITAGPMQQSNHMKPISLLLFLACMAWGQGTDGISTSVNRSISLTADEAAFSVVAAAGLETTQQQVTQIFLDAGIANLSVTGTALGQSYDYSKNPPSTQTGLLYQFAFTVPAAGLKDAAKKMEALRTSPPGLLHSMQYTAALNASQATVDAARQTLLPQLFADAQKKAQTIAVAAGLKLGAIKSVSESFYGYGSYNSWIGTVSFGNGFSSSGSSSGTQYTFTAMITFGVAAQ